MSRLPSAETQLRNLKSEHRRIVQTLQATMKERDAYRVRATKAEQAAKEWQERFDVLLRRETP